MAKLVILTGKNRGKRMTLPERDVLIGRDKTCAISLATDEVSREHCLLRFAPATLFARDLNSRNGTFVNDHPISDEVELQHGDILRVGPMMFRVETRTLVPGAAAGSPPSPGSAVVDRPTPAPFPFEDRPTPMPAESSSPTTPAPRGGHSEDSVVNWLIEDEPKGGTGDSTILTALPSAGDTAHAIPAGQAAPRKVFASVEEEAADIIRRHREAKHSR